MTAFSKTSVVDRITNILGHGTPNRIYVQPIIEAMREPSADMIRAGKIGADDDPELIALRWRKMVDHQIAEIAGGNDQAPAEFEMGREFFGHRLNDENIYPAQHCCIFWNNVGPDFPENVNHVSVAFMPRPPTGSIYFDDIPGEKLPAYDKACSDYASQFENSAGNDAMDWMGHNMATPDAVWATLNEIGFANRVQRHRAIREFAKIDCCNWARTAQIVARMSAPTLYDQETDNLIETT